MFTFQWPWLALLLPLPFFVWRFLRSNPGQQENAGHTPRLLFPQLQILENAFANSAYARPRLKILTALLFATWALLVCALMRPQIVNHSSFVKNESHDLMLAVDLSGSMQSLDFAGAGGRQNRLDVAKSVVKDFVKKQNGDRVGLIVFGEHAYLHAPLTYDTAAVTQMLDNTLPGMAGDATAIGDAIGLGIKNLRGRPANSRAIILLTDGEDNASTLPPLQAANLAKQYGIRIYTIVIGKDGLVPFPDGQGGYTTVESHVDTALTRKIAAITDGEFFRATDPGMLAKIYDHIDALQRSETEPPPVLIRHPLFQYPLALALILFLAFACVNLFRGDDHELFPV